jgi:pimeloyl-ACP methyl ester carboxylesterase
MAEQQLRSFEQLKQEGSTMNNMERHEIVCPNIGSISVYIKGTRSSNEVVILTIHDLGCDHTMYMEFVEHPKMSAIRSRTVWVHVDVPGQSQDAPDLPTDYQFPSLQQIGEDLVSVLDQTKIKEVIGFGEGAGANILARFAAAHPQRVLGICLMHTTGNAAGLMESLKDKVFKRKLDALCMTQSTESYLLLHRFGTVGDKEELKTIVDGYLESLRSHRNAKNLKKFVEAFLKRTNIAEIARKLNCPILLVTGQQSIFNSTTRSFHQTILKSCADKTKVEFIEVGNVANVLEEKPDKLVECFQYFLQGLGLVSSVPMQNVTKPPRGRSMSMQDYDMPLRQRIINVHLSSTSPPPPPLPDSLPPPLCSEGSEPGTPTGESQPSSDKQLQQQQQHQSAIGASLT